MTMVALNVVVEALACFPCNTKTRSCGQGENYKGDARPWSVLEHTRSNVAGSKESDPSGTGAEVGDSLVVPFAGPSQIRFRPLIQ